MGGDVSARLPKLVRTAEVDAADVLDRHRRSAPVSETAIRLARAVVAMAVVCRKAGLLVDLDRGDASGNDNYYLMLEELGEAVDALRKARRA